MHPGTAACADTCECLPGWFLPCVPDHMLVCRGARELHHGSSWPFSHELSGSPCRPDMAFSDYTARLARPAAAGPAWLALTAGRISTLPRTGQWPRPTAPDQLCS